MSLDFDELFQVFLAESDECLLAIEQGLLDLEARPDNASAIDTVFRAAHTLKGNISSLGFHTLASFAHEMESLLERVRHHDLETDPDLITVLLAAVDTMKSWIPGLTPEVDAPMTPEQTAAYDRLFARSRSESLVNPAFPAVVGDEREGEAAQAPESVRTIRVASRRMDELLDLSGEMAIAAERVRQQLEALPLEHRQQIGDTVAEYDRLVRDLHETVMRCRMVPIGPAFRRHIRTVRDLARASGKRARLQTEGEDVEVDLTVMEHLGDPLNHLIRNALDHGIERPDVRVAQGKEPTGTVRLRAHRHRGSIVVEVSDDGAGIRRDRVREKAIATGRVPQSSSDADLVRLIFEPGFSTAESVSEVSGRGVGMDVVRRNIEQIRGQISVESIEGQGTTFTLRLPLALAVISGFVVGVAGEQFVVPMSNVYECFEMLEQPGGESDGVGVINVRGQVVPYVRLRDHFHFGGEAPGRQMAVVLEHNDSRAGIVVDTLFGEAQTVIKPLGPMLRGLSGVSGTAVMGNGRVALVLEPVSLFRQLETKVPEVA